VGGQLGVGGRDERDDLGGVGEAELFGLFAQPLGGDGEARAESGVVAKDHVVEIEQPIVGGQVMTLVPGVAIASAARRAARW
jgi:hypothetical protein